MQVLVFDSGPGESPYPCDGGRHRRKSFFSKKTSEKTKIRLAGFLPGRPRGKYGSVRERANLVSLTSLWPCGFCRVNVNGSS
jgi:hypothetical protein